MVQKGLGPTEDCNREQNVLKVQDGSSSKALWRSAQGWRTENAKTLGDRQVKDNFLQAKGELAWASHEGIVWFHTGTEVDFCLLPSGPCLLNREHPKLQLLK